MNFIAISVSSIPEILSKEDLSIQGFGLKLKDQAMRIGSDSNRWFKMNINDIFNACFWD